MAQQEEEEEDVHFQNGKEITTNKATYKVEKLLGEGGFGAVYRVVDTKDANKMYAMKVERKKADRKDSKLKMEIAILKMVGAERKGKSHFTDIIDRGKRDEKVEKDSYYFIVMQLVGKSLADLKAKMPQKVFTMCCGLGVAMQCLEACQDLHKHGFIHRDLKPANYACGLADKKRVIYILDFGIARKFTNDKNELKTPREKARFKGTVKFASIACHKNIELGPKDDCESWFYLLIDVIQPLGLPWKKIQNRDDVLRCKEDCRKDGSSKKGDLYESLICKGELELVVKYIDSLKYYEKVDYNYVYDVLKVAATTAGGSLDDPYDWEKGEDGVPPPTTSTATTKSTYSKMGKIRKEGKE